MRFLPYANHAQSRMAYEDRWLRRFSQDTIYFRRYEAVYLLPEPIRDLEYVQVFARPAMTSFPRLSVPKAPGHENRGRQGTGRAALGEARRGARFRLLTAGNLHSQMKASSRFVRVRSIAARAPFAFEPSLADRFAKPVGRTS
jgi:hypothetical protein